MEGPFEPLGPPDVLPTASPGLVFSPDGRYLAVNQAGANPYLSVYKNDAGSLRQIFTNGFGPDCYTAEWHPNGNLLFCGYRSTTGMRLFSRSGDTFTHVAGIGDIPNNTTFKIAIDDTGTYIATAIHSGSGGFRIYKWNGSQSSYLGIPPGMATGISGNGVAWTPGATHVALSHPFANGTGVSVWKRNGDSFAKLTIPSVNTQAYSVTFSPDGNVMLAGGNGQIYVFTRSGDAFTLLDPPLSALIGFVRWLRFSADGRILVAAGSHGVILYEVDGTTFTPTDQPEVKPAGTNNAADITKDGIYLGITSDASPYLYMYGNYGRISNAVFPVFTASGEIDYIGQDIDGSGDFAFPNFAASALAEISEHEVYPSPPILLAPVPIHAGIGPVGYSYDLLDDAAGELTIPIESNYIDVCARGATTSEADPAHPYLYVIATFPAFGVAGGAELSYRTHLDARFPGFRTDGWVRFPLELESASTFPAFNLSADLDINVIGIGGAVEFPGFTSAGETDSPLGAVGSLALPMLGASGDVHLPMGVGGSLSFPHFNAASRVDIPLKVSAEARFSTFRASGVGDILIPDEYEVIGNIRFPALGSRAVIDMPLWITSSIGLRPFSSSGVVNVPLAVSATLGFRPFAGGGRLGTTNKVDANTTFPRFQASGGAGYPIDGGAELPFPAFGTVGRLSIFYSAVADAVFPAFRAAGELKLQYKIDAAPSFPDFGGSGQLRSFYRISSEAAFPSFGSDAVVSLTYNVSLDATFPSFAASGRIGRSMNAGGGLGMGGGMKGTFAIGTNIIFGRAGTFRIG